MYIFVIWIFVFFFKFVCWNIDFNVVVWKCGNFMGWLGYEGRVFMNGMGVFINWVEELVYERDRVFY